MIIWLETDRCSANVGNPWRSMEFIFPKELGNRSPAWDFKQLFCASWGLFWESWERREGQKCVRMIQEHHLINNDQLRNHFPSLTGIKRHVMVSWYLNLMRNCATICRWCSHMFWLSNIIFQVYPPVFSCFFGGESGCKPCSVHALSSAKLCSPRRKASTFSTVQFPHGDRGIAAQP